MKRILLTVMGLSSVLLITGCSKNIDKESYEELKWDEVGYAARHLVRELTKPLELDVNTNHPYSITENGNPDGEVNSSSFRSGDYGDYFAKQCQDKFNLNKDDIEVKWNFFKGTSYSVNKIDSNQWKAFNDCVVDRFNNEQITSEDLRIFLTEPNLIKFKDVPEIREHINKIKTDNLITLKEVIDTYVLLDQVDAHSFNNENKTLLEEL